MNSQELLDINTQIRDYGSQLYSIMLEIYRLTGLTSALDSSFDQRIFDMGKALPNSESRKIAKDNLRAQDENYSKWVDMLTDYKHEKLRITYERDALKSELEICIIECKRDTAKLESETLARWVDQTNYIQSLEQEKLFLK